jgi:predicted AlkP superfamily pyrophosphatase or phosphodiesterase
VSVNPRWNGRGRTAVHFGVARPRVYRLGLAVLLIASLSARVGRAKPVLLVSVDGLLPESYLEPDRLGLAVPNLRALVREGAWATGAVSVTPSITFPAHTTMITGVSPVRHGVLSNEVFDPDGKLGGGWYWHASDVKVPTLFDQLRAAGLRSAAVTWPATAGGPIDLNLPDMYPVANLKEAKNLMSLARVGGAAAALDEVLPSVESLVRLRDETRLKVALRFLRERPDLLAVHFLELDDAQHTWGPRSPEAKATLERLDGYLGALLDELRAQARLEETAVVLVSDHGFVPIEREVRVGTLLRTLGLLTLDAQGRLTAWRAFFWPQGGSAAIYLHPQATAEDRRKLDDAIRLLQSNPAWGIGKVFRGAEVPSLGGLPGAYAVLDALPGFCFGRSMDGPEMVVAKIGGIHGHHPGRADARASLVISGPGIRKNASIGLVRLLDVAPTLARILGVDLGKVEGRVLTQAFDPLSGARSAAQPARAGPR